MLQRALCTTVRRKNYRFGETMHLCDVRTMDEIVSVTIDDEGAVLISTKLWVYRVNLEDEIPVIRRIGPVTLAGPV